MLSRSNLLADVGGPVDDLILDKVGGTGNDGRGVDGGLDDLGGRGGTGGGSGGGGLDTGVHGDGSVGLGGVGNGAASRGSGLGDGVADHGHHCENIRWREGYGEVGMVREKVWRKEKRKRGVETVVLMNGRKEGREKQTNKQKNDRR